MSMAVVKEESPVLSNTAQLAKAVQMFQSTSRLDRITKNLADIGAIALDDYLDGHCPAPPTAPDEGNAVTRLHQACQHAFRNTDALKFEFVEQTGSRSEPYPASAATPDLGHRQAMHSHHHQTRRRAPFLRDTAPLCEKERGKVGGCKDSNRHGCTRVSCRRDGTRKDLCPLRRHVSARLASTGIVGG